MTYRNEWPWKLHINFIPFDSITQRDQSYELWAESYFHQRILKAEKIIHELDRGRTSKKGGEGLPIDCLNSNA